MSAVGVWRQSQKPHLESLCCRENYYDGEGHDEEGSASDLAFARRLQAEEMQSQYSRLLDMAGM